MHELIQFKCKDWIFPPTHKWHVWGLVQACFYNTFHFCNSTLLEKCLFFTLKNESKKGTDNPSFCHQTSPRANKPRTFQAVPLFPFSLLRMEVERVEREGTSIPKPKKANQTQRPPIWIDFFDSMSFHSLPAICAVWAG